MPPILKEVKDELKEGVRIIKVNVDKNPFIATQYQIRSIPTIIIFKNGIPQWKGVGVCHASELKAMIRKHIE
jgi:thioredoxin 1